MRACHDAGEFHIVVFMNSIFIKSSGPTKLFYRAVSASLSLLGLALAAGAGTTHAADASSFYLKAGDRVCFYGDSITEQRYYGADVETFVRTRFPGLRVKFVNSGVGGDKVGGGWAGPIDLRLKRDVFPFKPNVVTIMLGMNDAQYRPFDEHIFAAYTNGYEHIIQSLQKNLPGVRIVLIQPTPYDDVTEPPKFPGGYNAVLLRYSAFVQQLAAEHHLMCVDFMTPLVDLMQKAQAEDPKLAPEVIPGRVHPSVLGELVMAQALLQAWNAPSTVSSVAIDAAKKSVPQSDGATVNDLMTETDGGLSWTQRDESLPFPVLGLHEDWPQFPPTENDEWGHASFLWPAPQPKWNYTNTAAQMILQLSGFQNALNQERLQVAGLSPGNYQLKINDQIVGDFSDRQLNDGLNLADYHTPMLKQSYYVLALVWRQIQWRYFAWRDIQLRLAADHDPEVQKAAAALVAAMEAQKDKDAEQQYVAAQPKPAHYELTRVQ